jgi:hypothetical protein
LQQIRRTRDEAPAGQRPRRRRRSRQERGASQSREGNTTAREGGPGPAVLAGALPPIERVVDRRNKTPADG